MAEAEQSVSHVREQFIVREFDQARQADDSREELVRGMAWRMELGEDYSADDFLFVASMGQPELYRDEAKTLIAMAEVDAGDLVGVLSHTQHLTDVGVVGEPKLSFKVRSGLMPTEIEKKALNEQYNRELEAYLHLWKGQIRSEIDDGSFYDSLSRVVAPVSILHGRGEPKHYQGHKAFYEPHTLLVGEGEVMDFLRTEGANDTDYAMVTNFLGRMATGAYSATFEAAEAEV